MTKLVYLIKAEDTDNFKIGFTTQDPEKRVNQLQTGSGNKLKLLKTFPTKYGTKLESRLHYEFRHKRIEGEWFLLDAVDVAHFEKKCQSFEQMYDILKDNPFFK